MQRPFYKIIIASSLLACATPVISAELKPFATEMFDETSPVVDFELNNNAQFRNVNITVAGPRGFSKSQNYNNGALDLNNDELDDGEYNYEIIAVTNKRIQLRKDRPDNGRGDKERDYVLESVSQSGHFRVQNGNIVIFDQNVSDTNSAEK